MYLGFSFDLIPSAAVAAIENASVAKATVWIRTCNFINDEFEGH
jgi:hypothetical protein